MHMKAGKPSNGMVLLYFCHIDWNWIKQRPQFLEEELEKYCDVHVIYPWSNRRGNMIKHAHSPMRCTRIYSLPAPGRMKKYFHKLNDALRRIQVHQAVKRVKPDVVWLPHPEYLAFLPDAYQGSVVYDCMDDYAYIAPEPERRNELIAQENELIARAQCVFISSRHLADKLANRIPLLANKWVLLRNGYHSQWEQREVHRVQAGNTFHIGYFGTIGRWFDWETLLWTLQRDERIVYDLYGPVELGTRLAEHERIRYHGIVMHDQIPEVAESLHALIMPFKRCEIVDSVDPIKLYEYICLGKRIYSVAYPEIERFGEFISFYTTAEELSALIMQMETGDQAGYTTEDAVRFLQENTWECRGKTVWEHLNRIGSGPRGEE